MVPQNAVRRFIPACVLCACACCCTVQALQAQAPPTPGSIHASGQHELKLEPQKLRLTLNIRAEGNDAKSAVESLMAHKERVKTELLDMKADEESIEFGATQLSSGVAGMPEEWQRYGSRMLAQMSRGSTTSPGELPKIYQVVSQVRAEWPLPTTDPDALALLPETLKEQVKTRDLTGENNKANLDAQQQEKLEEFQAAMQEAMGYYSGDDSSAPVTVLFVAKVTDELRKQSIQAAYERAVAQAELLASATGQKMGELLSLRSSNTPSLEIEELQSPYAAAYAAYAASQMTTNSTGDEAQATNSGGLKVSARVDVEFVLLK